MKASYKAIASFSVSVVLVTLIMATSFWAFGQIEESAKAHRHSFVVIDRANQLLSVLKDIETGQRGYLLTGDEVFLDLYLNEKDKVAGYLETLRSLTVINSIGQQHLDAVVPLMAAKLAEMGQAIALYRNHEVSAALARVRSGSGKQLMDSIRAELGGFIRLEEKALIQNDAEFQASMHNLFAIIVTASLFTLLFELWFALFIYRESQQRFKNLLHVETQHLLETQQEINKQLQKAIAIRNQSEAALLDKNAELECAKRLAEKANLAKSNFLSSMSHELRTPLNAILGFAQLLEVGTPPPTTVQLTRLHQIIKAGWYLLELINEVLDLALIESGKLSLSREPVALIEVMHECAAMIEAQAQQRDICLTFFPFDNTWIVYADRTRIKQVLINLLSNAIKYNREHGIVEINCTQITPGYLRISIIDSGAGLPPEKLAQLFQPFNRLGQEIGSVEGTGIGLVVSKQLVELMGGTIGVESTVGIGSTFWVELLQDNAPQLADEQLIIAKLTSQTQKNVALNTLLYVEDNPANLMLVEQIIEGRESVAMLSAKDAKLGIALARAHLPDVILMDINLPGISGTQALKILREDQTTMHIPVIALSANAMPSDISKGLEAGFFRYLTKPIKINEFMNAIDEALEKSKTQSGNANLGLYSEKPFHKA